MVENVPTRRYKGLTVVYHWHKAIRTDFPKGIRNSGKVIISLIENINASFNFSWK